MNPKIAAKLLSGRLFLTVICGIAFLYSVYMKLIEPAAISAILTMVFANYFNRDRSSNGDSNVDKGQGAK